MDDDGQIRTYGPQRVCDAAGVPRPTFHSWIARRFLPLLPLAPGMGRERRFTILDAVRIAVAAELTSFGVYIGVAGHVVGNIGDKQIGTMDDGPFIDPAERWALILVKPSSRPDRQQDQMKVPAHAFWRFRTMADIDHALDLRFVGGRPTSFMMLDITAITTRIRAALEADGAVIQGGDAVAS